MSYPSSQPEPTVPFGQPTPAETATNWAVARPGEPTNAQLHGPPSYPVQPAAYPTRPVAYYPVAYPVDPRLQAYQNGLYAAQKSRVAAGLLAIFLGSLGIHNFYLGRTGIALLQLLLSVLTLGVLAPAVAVWALIEGILILVRSPSFAADRRGIPLRD